MWTGCYSCRRAECRHCYCKLTSLLTSFKTYGTVTQSLRTSLKASYCSQNPKEGRYQKLWQLVRNQPSVHSKQYAVHSFSVLNGASHWRQAQTRTSRFQERRRMYSTGVSLLITKWLSGYEWSNEWSWNILNYFTVRELPKHDLSENVRGLLIRLS